MVSGGGVSGGGGGVRVAVNEELKFLLKIKKKIGGGTWGHGGCERRIEVFGKIHKKKNSGRGVRRGVRWGVGLVGGGGQRGCECNVGGRG